MTLCSIPLGTISCFSNLRRDLGERDGSLDRLINSIAQQGLLTPLTVTTICQLISGYRRLEALKHLGYTEAPCVVIDLDDILSAQADANGLHKLLTVVEQTCLAVAICDAIGNRQGHKTPTTGIETHAIQSGVLTTTYAAKKAGLGSRKTFERARRVLEDGCQELVQALDEGKVSVLAAAELASLPEVDQVSILRGGKQALKKFRTARRAPVANDAIGAVTQEIQSLAKSLQHQKTLDNDALTNITQAIRRLTSKLDALVMGTPTYVQNLAESLLDGEVQPVSHQPSSDPVQVPGTDLVLERWIGKEPNPEDVPESDPSYVFSTSLVAALQSAIQNRQNVALIGPPGNGKTTLIEQVAAIVGAPLIKVEGHSHMNKYDLLGKDDLKNGTVVFKKGPLTRAFEKGYWFLFDEITAVSPGVLHTLHGILNDDAILRLDGDQVIRRSDGFRFFATSNTIGAAATHLHRSQGNRQQADSTLSRLSIKLIPSPLTREAVIELLKRWSRGPQAHLPSDAPALLANWFLEVRKAALDTYAELQYAMTLRELRALWLMWQTPVETKGTSRPWSVFAATRYTILNALARPEERRLVLELLSTYFDLEDDTEFRGYLEDLEILTCNDGWGGHDDGSVR